MTRTTRILIILILILTFAACVSVLYSFTSPNKPNPLKRSTIKNVSDQDLFNKLITLLDSKNDQKCAINASIKNIPVTGNIFVSNKSMRGEFEPEFTPIAINGNFILDSANLYIWTDMDKNGYKIPISSQEAQSKKDSALSLIKLKDISCTPWRPDPDKFKLPANINFQNENVPNSSADKLFE